MENVHIERKLILTENTKRHRVPHCAECKRCQCTDFIYKDYYCCEENDTMQIFGRLGVDHQPKTSTKWCPVKNNENK